MLQSVLLLNMGDKCSNTTSSHTRSSFNLLSYLVTSKKICYTSSYLILDFVAMRKKIKITPNLHRRRFSATLWQAASGRELRLYRCLQQLRRQRYTGRRDGANCFVGEISLV